jgi:hypothetical protein
VRDFNPAHVGFGSSTVEGVEATRARMSDSLQKRTSECLPRYVRLVPGALTGCLKCLPNCGWPCGKREQWA